MDVVITFEFAKWNRDQLKKSLEKDEARKQAGGWGKFDEMQYAHKQAKLCIWEGFCAATCPGHDWKLVDEEKGLERCTICQTINSWYEEAHAMTQNVTQGCHNCAYLERLGGDPVPYGSATVRLPEQEYCNHPILETMSDEEEEEWHENLHKPGVVCEHWEGITLD